MRKRPDRAYIFLHDSKAGLPERHPGGYRFRYDPDYLQQPDALPVSLTLPLSDKVYESKELFPFFTGLLPEGRYLDIVSRTLNIVNSRLFLPGEKEECCLSIQGKRNKVRRNDFMTLADHLTLKSEEYENVFDRLYSLQGEFEKMIGLGCLPADMQEGFMEIFRERMKGIGVPN